MSIEAYVHSRAGTQSDKRTGTLAEGPARIQFIVRGADPDLYPVIELATGDSLMIEIHEQDASAPVQSSPTRAAAPQATPKAKSGKPRKKAR